MEEEECMRDCKEVGKNKNSGLEDWEHHTNIHHGGFCLRRSPSVCDRIIHPGICFIDG